MSKRTQKYLVLILIAVCIPISSCNINETANIFDNQACEAPCWRNIQPGRTNLDEVMKLVLSYSDVTENRIHQGGNKLENGYIAIDLPNRLNVIIYFIDNIVSDISFNNPDGIASFGDCVSEFGIPDNIVQTSVMGFGLPLGATSTSHTWVYVLNPKNGTAYGFDTYSYFGKIRDLTKDTMVGEIKYFDPNAYEILLVNGYLVKVVHGDGITTKKLYPWLGYGDIDVLYPEK